MLPLIPIALSLVPQIARWLGGEKAGEVTQQVADVIQSVTGKDASTGPGAAELRGLLQSNPALAAQLQMRLAEIAAQREAEADRETDAARQAVLEEMRQQVADLAQARNQTVSLAQAHSPLAWGAPVISVLILVGFVWMLWLVVARPAVAANLSGELANVLLGTLAAMATQVANYWLGSSLGSAQKNQIVASAHAAALAVRAPEVPSADELNRRALSAARGA